MDLTEGQERFIRLLTEHQNSLFAYVVSLVGNLHDAGNILQETNLVLWRKADEFEQATDFVALARKVAYVQTLAFLRDRKRDRHRFFDEALLHQLAKQPQPEAAEEERRLALRHCLTELTDKHREMLAARYGTGESIRELAERWQRSESAVKMSLARIRQGLLRCIQRQLGEQV